MYRTIRTSANFKLPLLVMLLNILNPMVGVETYCAVAKLCSKHVGGILKRIAVLFDSVTEQCSQPLVE
jgi:hypothetical protein